MGLKGKYKKIKEFKDNWEVIEEEDDEKKLRIKK